MMKNGHLVIPVERVQEAIYLVRGQKVMLDKDFARKLAELKKRIASHDESIQLLFQAIRQLMNEPVPPRKRIGFHLKERHSPYMARVKKGHPN